MINNKRRTTMAEQKKKHVRINTEDRSLPVMLSRDETLDYGKKLADAHQAMTELELEEVSFKQQIKSRMAIIESEIGAKSCALRQGYEHRKVKCEITMDYDHGIIRITRTDTGKEVESRKMTDSERQLGFESIEKELASNATN